MSNAPSLAELRAEHTTLEASFPGLERRAVAERSLLAAGHGDAALFSGAQTQYTAAAKRRGELATQIAVAEKDAEFIAAHETYRRSLPEFIAGTQAANAAWAAVVADHGGLSYKQLAPMSAGCSGLTGQHLQAVTSFRQAEAKYKTIAKPLDALNACIFGLEARFPVLLEIRRKAEEQAVGG